ncbi:MAG: 23S rRNA (pseudouridine(1915)-N(3))-methyltransferase RlmH [Ruminococcaceae bacterium]|nr:23S rRNA (pseudouridine(1915)-N(3))-methyltransferase RlmH [Oscillospiraceae bacterium]
MLGVKLITLGTLKESYWREAAAEYEKRLGAFCRLEIVQLKEERLAENPTDGEIRTALEKEAAQILRQIPPKAYRIALCVEGKQLSSEELSVRLAQIAETHGEVCLIIGSSFGLADSVKEACDLRLSVSRLTFPHQLMRVLLLETVYRSFQIQKGTRYHK